ncbi:hypothetical protein VPH35_077834 [Triticum aestivum]
MQLQLEDERIRQKKCDFQRRKELERRQKAACVQRSDRDVTQAPEGVGDEGGDTTFSTVDAGSHGSDMPAKTNLMQTRLTQVFIRDVVKEKKAVLNRKMSDRNPDGTQRHSPRVKAGSKPGNSKADGDSVVVKIGPSKLGGSPVRCSPRALTNKKPSSPPLRERSLLKENSKCKVHPAKVSKGVKKRARVEAEDVVSEEDDIEVDSEDEFVVIEQDEAAATDSRADDGTEANVSDHHTNDVGLAHPVVDETSHNVEAAIDHGVNDPSTDKCKGPVVGDEPCSPVGDVALNVSSRKIDDVVVNASMMTDVEREAVVSCGDDARGVPFSSGHDVGTKVADEDVGAASIPDAKSSGVAIARNENVSDCEDLLPENFPPGGLDYGDALQAASSVEEVPSEDDDLVLSISSGPLTQEALVSSQDFFSTDPESAAILLSSQDLPSSNPENGGMLVSSQELPSSSNADSAESGNVVKVDMFFFAVTRLHTNRTKRHDCGFFVLQSCKTYHCREDGVIEMLDYCHEDILDIRKTFLYTCATSDVFDVDFRGLFGIEPFELLDLDEHDYMIFGSQFSDLERVSIDLSQGRSPEKTRTGVIKGRLGALKGSMAAYAESPSTPKNPIVELIDSDDDAFDKIAGMGRVTRSTAAAKGLSPLARIVARSAGGARKDPALDYGNVTSTKHAPRAPIKFCSPVQRLHPHKFPHLEKARKLYNLLLSYEACEKYAENTFSMIPQPDDSVTSFTGKRIWEVFAPGQMMEGDVMDFLIDDWKKYPDRNVDFVSGKRVLLSPYFITPRIVDWNAEDLYRVVFNRNNQLLVTELPNEYQPLAPGA